MSFFSTRGESCVTASQAILRGIAPDGGLYVPAMFQAVPPERLTTLTEMNYEERAVVILKRFLEDFSIREIEDAVKAAYSRERFRRPGGRIHLHDGRWNSSTGRHWLSRISRCSCCRIC